MIHGVNTLSHDFCTYYPTEPIVSYNTYHMKHFLIIYFTVILPLCKIFNKALLLFSPYCNKYRGFPCYFISICTNIFINLSLFLNFPHFTSLSGSLGSIPAVSMIASVLHISIQALHPVHSILSII